MSVLFRIATMAGLAVSPLAAASPVFAEDKPLLDYGIDLVSDYVSRGEDVYVRRFDKDEEKHTAVNMAPALQPSVTFHGTSGISLNLWGSFALAHRGDDDEKGFLGLGRDDELDYTLAFDWSNRLGGFTAAVTVVSYFDSCYQATNGACNRETSDPEPVQPEVLIRWAAPFAHRIHPAVAYYATSTPGDWYANLGFSGGESIFWAASLGAVGAGPTDLTFKLGYAAGDMKVSLDGAYRPNPELVGPYDKDGHYTVNNQRETYPSTILWMTLSYAGRVTEK